MSDYWNTEFETMPWNELHNYWVNKFNEQIVRVKENSAFYRKHLEKIDKISSFDDLTSIPVMTKNEIREAQLAGGKTMPLGTIQAAPIEEIVQVISSSGTTGRPVYYGVTRRDLEVWRDALASFTYILVPCNSYIFG